VTVDKIRCIECEEIELARVRDERPTQILDIPHAALAGDIKGRAPYELTRRRLLQWGASGAAAVYGSRQLGFEEIWESVAAAADDAATDKCLVLLYLAGGNDGLNVILPNGAADYAAYQTARPFIGRNQGATPKDADGNPLGKIGSHPLPGAGGAALAFSGVTVSKAGGGDNWAKRFGFTGTGDFGFDTLYGDGTGGPGSNLAVMPAVDAKKYSLSHFDNSDIWFAASNDINVKTGWLGRWIDRNGSATNPLQAVSIDSALSKSIRTAVNPVCAIPSLPMAGFTMNSNNYGGSNGFDANGAVNTLAGIAVGAGNAYLKRSHDTYGLAYSTYNDVKAIGAAPANALYPNSGTLSSRLRMAAHLLAANLGTRIITIHWGGFDTHTNQLGAQDKQLAELSRALGAFQADLTARGIDGRVATLVFSEFGRRVKETPDSTPGAGDAGTDHGAGGLMLAMGTGVRGGFAADWPGCRPQDLVPANNPAQGNLQVPTDFRSVFKAVIEEWLGDDDPAALLGPPLIDDLHRGDGLTGRKLFK
jgi:uncharacterized protein (DUF1501 family)